MLMDQKPFMAFGQHLAARYVKNHVMAVSLEERRGCDYNITAFDVSNKTADKKQTNMIVQAAENGLLRRLWQPLIGAKGKDHKFPRVGLLIADRLKGRPQSGS